MLYRGFRIPIVYHAGIQIYGANPEDDHRGNLFNCEVFAERDRLGKHRLHSFNFVEGRDYSEPSNEVVRSCAAKVVDENYKGMLLHKMACPWVNEDTIITASFQKRVAFYCRESQFDHGGVRQQKDCLKAIEENPDWRLEAGYIDHAVTDPASTSDSAFRMLLRDCKAGLYDVVIVGNGSAFGNLVDIVYFTKLLRYRDADIYFCDEKLRYRNLNCSLMIDLFDILIPKPTKRYPSIFGNKDCYP